MTQYPPRHVQNELGVSASTVRRWSETFARHLSISATRPPRRYDDEDMARLRRIKALLDAGLRIEDVDARLDEPEPQPPTEPPSETPGSAQTALQPVTALLDTLNATQATQAQIATTLAGLGDLQSLSNTVADLRERVARLEAQVEELRRSGHDHPGIVPTRRPQN